MGKERHLSFDSFKCETNALNVLDGVHQWIKLAFGAMAELDSGVEVTLPCLSVRACQPTLQYSEHTLNPFAPPSSMG
jgi:hypothetical protein